ncbi:Asparaginyl-tRNA synthetase [Olavius algarvensis spirochete endosymbiont]|uniref:asparagine--tRNA ligase n=1 Tax=Olavius algarvensis spirochete endosymbiont TaxID=260710 RepID=UPI000F2ADFA8|nr:asparagine--tRNA ligase [Olavius algarvensis spirochete endosymbiont]VDA99184.1 Asparaginyl-tRNA synthetase [Olavius algarvensis spirochete endosymbiont]
MVRNSVSSLLAGPDDGRYAIVVGWIRTKRQSKNTIFFEVNDGSCLANLQIVVDKSGDVIDGKQSQHLLNGASIIAEGQILPSEGKEQEIELIARKMRLIGEVSPSYPLQKKRHSFEFLRDNAHLRPRTNTFGAITRVRNALSVAIHGFFQKREFLWIQTPIITGNDAEGAGNLFQVSTLDYSSPPRNDSGSVDYQKDFFGKKTYLTVSGQLQLENFACSMGKVYTFGPTFRAENSNTSRHLSEFWMIEPEMAFCELEENRELAESLIKELLSQVLERCPDEMELFDRWVSKGTIDNLKQVIDKPFIHLTYSEAIRELKKAPIDWEYPPAWGLDLQAEHERYLCEELIKGPLTLTDYPKEIKAFYMKQNDDGDTVRAMDILVPRLGEIIGGSQREDDFVKLRDRMKQMGMDMSEYSWYLDLRRYGSVPHSGFGLGFERLVQYITGMQNIRDVVPFPRSPKAIAF